MRIVLLNQYYAPDEAATAQILGDLGQSLRSSGHRVRVICCDRSYADPARRYPAHENLDGVEVVRVCSTGFGRSSRIGRLADYATFLMGAVRWLLFGLRPDVVISLTTPPMVALIGNACARLRGARSVFWSMDVYPDIAYELGTVRPGGLVGRILDRLAALTLQSSDVVIALGETMERRLMARGAKNVRVIHNWADEGSISYEAVTSARVTNTRQLYGWGERLVVMYSGNMGLGHEFETVLDGARIISEIDGQSNSETQGRRIDKKHLGSECGTGTLKARILFIFIGGGPRFEETRAKARRLGVQNVEFHPYASRDRLCDSLAAADLHVVTLRGRMAGLMVPSKIYGILAAGRPTLYVGPREGEVFDILRDGDCGSTIDIGDGERFAAAVQSYAYDPGKREEEGRKARALFEARFTKKRAIMQFSKLLESLR